MASVSDPASSSTMTAMPRAEERAVDEQIRRTRRSLKWVDFASGMITLVIGVLAFLLCVSMLEHWVVPGGWNGAGRVVLFVAMLGGIAWYSWRTFWPLVSRPINPAYAAQLIERSSPSLKNSLLNFLLLRNRRQQLSQKVYQAIEQQAAQRLSEVSLDSVIDRSALVRLGYVLVAVVVACALYRVLSPKNLTSSMERVLMPWSDIAVPSRVEISNVAPGDTQIARGEQLEVSAEVFGIRDDEPVKVRYSTLDGQSIDREVTLSASAGGSRFSGRLPDRFSGGDPATEGSSGGVQQDLEYWIEAGDAKSPRYKVTVFARPTLVVEKIRYQFAQYTGLAAREVEGTGDIHAIEGTKVTLYALANHDIASAQVDFNADGRHDLAMTADKAKASAQFTLSLGEDRRTPEFDRYVLQYKTTNGRVSSLPPTYTIDVTPDYAPEIRITAPVDDDGNLVEQLDVPLDSQFTVEVEARDPDFALTNVVVLGEVAGEQVLRHDLLTQNQSGKFVGRMTATPAELGLKPDDVLEYWSAAVDNRQPEPNTAQTERLRIHVLGPPQFGDQQGQGDQPQGGGEGESGEQSGGGESGEQGEGLSGAGEAGGESGEQGGEGGEGGAGEQNGEKQSEGEQQGQGGQGGGQGENSDSQESQGADGEPSSAGSDQQNGEQRSGEQSGEQQGEQQSDPAGQGGESSEGGDATQGQPGGQGKVSTEGDDDAEAFDRMNQHFAEEEAQAEGQEGEDGEGQQSEGDSQGDGGQSETQPGESAGEGKPDSDQSSKGESGEDAQTQDGGAQGPQQGEQSEGAGAEGQPSDQQKPQQGDSENGEGDEQQQPEGGKMSPEQGNQGAGNNPGDEQGSPDSPEGRKPKEKNAEQSPDSQENDQEAPMQGQGNKESDSQGGQGGDRAGGGQEGAGQQADSEGTGTAGENTAADEGAGQAEESGNGEDSSKAGQDAQSNKPTGESAKNQPGNGSKQSDQQGGSKPGGEQPGAQGGDAQQQPGASPPADGDQGQQPGESQPSGNPQAGGQQQGQPQDEQPPGETQPNANAGQQPPGAGTGSNNAAGQPPGEVEPGDAANLDYAKKQTDLVLDKLDDQLKKSDVDKELLEKLGWTEEELRQFVNRWKKLKAEAAIAPEEKQQELDDALRSLGLDRTRRTGFQSQAVKEKLRDLKDSYRGQTPLEYAEQVRAYIKGTATSPEEKKE